jgi:moderate conductance mechanosensitive channel
MQAPAQPAELPSYVSLEAAAAIAVVTLIAVGLGLLAGSLVRRLLLTIEGDRFHTQPIARTTVKAVRRVTFVLSFFVLLFPALEVAGVQLNIGWDLDDVSRWATQAGVRVLFIILLAFAANRSAGSVIRSAEHEMAEGDDHKTYERRQRLQTVGTIVGRFFTILIWSVASLMVLRELDVDITPVLTGAGIVGLAVGFGAQTLVKDIISGLFVIAEDQVRLGDSADINGIGGMVEEINLRTIVLRDLEGVVHHISNGEIRTLSNRSRDFAYYVIDIPVGYDDDTDRIVEAVQAVAKELMQDPAFASSILEPLEVLGVDAFKATEVTLRFRIKTLPLRRSEVGRELRRRIKKAFGQQGIKVPPPQMNVTVKRSNA